MQNPLLALGWRRNVFRVEGAYTVQWCQANQWCQPKRKEACSLQSFRQQSPLRITAELVIFGMAPGFSFRPTTIAFEPGQTPLDRQVAQLAPRPGWIIAPNQQHDGPFGQRLGIDNPVFQRLIGTRPLALKKTAATTMQVTIAPDLC